VPEADVRLDRVTKRFGDFTAVDDLSLAIEPGEFFSLLGPSGCGKTTTLRMIGGFEEVTEGRVLLGETDVTDLPPFKRATNTVFQNYALFPHLTIYENIAFGLRRRKTAGDEIRRQVSAMLDLVELPGFEQRKPNQLSGGQQQRIALARALVNHPRVLLLDEPLGALDLKLRKQMQVELKRIQSEVGITFIFVTHDQEEALSMSDRIAVMLDGRIEQLADPYTIYEHPDSAFVAGFIGQQNFFSGVAQEDGAVVKAEGLICRSSRKAPTVENGDNALAAVRPEAVDILETQPAADENVFSGVLAGVSHLGDVIQYVVTTNNQREVLARLPRTNAPRLLPGARVWCQWQASQCQVFTDEQAEFVLADPASELSEVIAGG
jgi:spermidine/putrescine transport system ATP-binding protein